MDFRNFQKNHLLSVLLFLILQIQSCNGFASMLVERASACWVDIRDTESEVIMNNLIKPASESPHVNDVSIDLYDKTTMNLIDIEKVGDQRVVYIDDFTKDGGQDEKVVVSFLLKLNVKDIPELGDLQYVMDAKVFPELDEDELDKLDGTEARMTAEFTHSRGCRNWRSHGRSGDNGLTLNIGIPASIFSQSDVKEHSIDVVAGWAGGHEAVTLTESIEFRPFVNDEQPDFEKEEVDVEEEEEENIAEEVEEDQDLHAEQKMITGADVTSEEKDGENDETSAKSGLRKYHKRDIVHEIHEKKKHRDKHHHLNLHKFNKMYQESRFGQSSFSSSSYVKGVLAFLVLGAVIIKVCLAMGKKGKGRRNL